MSQFLHRLRAARRGTRSSDLILDLARSSTARRRRDRATGVVLAGVANPRGESEWPTNEMAGSKGDSDGWLRMWAAELFQIMGRASSVLSTGSLALCRRMRDARSAASDVPLTWKSPSQTISFPRRAGAAEPGQKFVHLPQDTAKLYTMYFHLSPLMIAHESPVLNYQTKVHYFRGHFYNIS